ncbi:AEC family transporter [Hyphomicrobium sp. LHD-15]|uniref:AEC family transporter n=1 Tax=Hyphomicrobium sp. LHD-15 TaxID=3072142 RepID=UPI00280F7244|nr:AEC family transporter [Hyphomicrobium sp. LHD-15]MDQ8697589.1 AEC family transporter [Hyphomicrobium sp. LHD-15]
MLSILSIVAPIFALIASGYAARKIGVMGQPAVAELNRFVVYLALPALLFDVMAHASWSDLAQPGFIGAFGLACGLVFYATLGLSLIAGRSLASASIEGLLGAYANTAYIGFPVLLMVFGKESLVPITIASILTVCVLFASAIVLIEIGSQSERRPLRLALKVAGSLTRNPLLIAPVLGVAYGATGLGLPVAADTFLRLLGGAASPLALVVIGLFLAEPRPVAAADARAAAALATVKLIVHPALTWALAIALSVPPKLTAMAVLLAALPTGTGPFMLAEYYRLPAVVTSAVILISTIGALLTLPLLMLATGSSGVGLAP